MRTIGEASGRVIDGLDAFRRLSGVDLGTSAWHTIAQADINAFAAATDDSELIHLDEEAAALAGLDSTIAHGLYTLSLGPKFLQEIYTVTGYSRVLNYGFERVRFLLPVPVNSRIRMNARLEAVDAITGGSKFTFRESFEIEGEQRPACVADAVVAYFD